MCKHISWPSSMTTTDTMTPDTMTPEERAKIIIAGLFVPSDPARLGESPVSVEQLTQQISDAIRTAVAEERTAILVRAQQIVHNWQLELALPSKDPVIVEAMILTGRIAVAIRARA